MWFPLVLQLGVTKTQAPSTSGSSVFVGILVTGLLAAVAITLGYFKCQRRSDTKDVKLVSDSLTVPVQTECTTFASLTPSLALLVFHIIQHTD